MFAETHRSPELQRADTVLHNAAELHIDLSDITDVIITHNHGDHTAGLVTLRRELMKRNPRALSRAHVVPGRLPRRATPRAPTRPGWRRPWCPGR